MPRLLLAALLAVATSAAAVTPTEAARDRLLELLSRGGRPPELTSFGPTGLDGLYEAVLGGDEGPTVLYFAPAKDWIFNGDLVDLAARQNLTQEVREKALAARLRPVVATLPLEKALRIGSGPHVVIEITDPDCPYCRRVEPFFKARADVTRYVFFAPLAHPQAARKVAFILQASDPSKAYEKAMSGGLDDPEAMAGFKSISSIEALAERHLEVARSLGVHGTPWFFVDGTTPVNGANEGALTRALAGEAPRPAAPRRP
jgi:thiol:disulfide interchange protein DsbC